MVTKATSSQIFMRRTSMVTVTTNLGPRQARVGYLATGNTTILGMIMRPITGG